MENALNVVNSCGLNFTNSESETRYTNYVKNAIQSLRRMVSVKRMKKKNARILDATAGNRTMWKTKESPHIIYIDIEPDLEYPPDRFLDNTKTDFPDNYFNAIFFDPPNLWGKKKNELVVTTPSKKVADEKFNYGRKYPTYYGLDKYSTKIDLLIFINKAQKEFQRILKPNGMLWLKWSEVKITMNQIRPFFREWDEMICIKMKLSPVGKNRSFWIMYMKNSENYAREEKGSLILNRAP